MNKKVLTYSYEMTNKQFFKKFISQLHDLIGNL